MVKMFQDVPTRNTFRSKFRFTIGRGYYTFWHEAQQVLAVPNSSIRPSSCVRPWQSSSSGEGAQPDSRTCHTRRCCRPCLCTGRAFRYVYQRVSIGVGQFSTRSVLAQNFLVMEFVHGYFWQFQNTEAQIDRSVDDYFGFCCLIDTRFSVMMSQWSVVGLDMIFFTRVGFITFPRSIFYVDFPWSFRKAYYWDFYNETVKMRILRLVSSWYWSRCRALSRHSVWSLKFDGR